MADTQATLFDRDSHARWVRLHTLINLRWLAVVGQSGAVLFASFNIGLQLNIELCLVAIATSIIFNIVSSIVYPENKRLSEIETFWTLLFDLAQLIVQLFLTGGLNNPFALLILAPVTISATSLRLQPTVILSALAIAMITVLMQVHLPLYTSQGSIFRMPPLFIAGFWIALVTGVLFLTVYARRVTLETNTMSQALIATQMALSRQQKLTDLGGVVAATAHELGTPLATIKLASAELADELADNKDLVEDARLIHQQADRCRDILRDMGRAGNDDRYLQHAPISAIVTEAAEPHGDRGVDIFIDERPKRHSDAKQPSVLRQPEIVHGIRNLVQNAVDFAEDCVWIDIRWSDETVTVTVSDDGPGYPPELIGKIGDPFLRTKTSRADKLLRPSYEGMGLGLFIAKTLLNRSGADLTFANGTDPFLHMKELPVRCGAIVAVVWSRPAIEQDFEVAHGPLGKNQPISF